MSTDNSTSATSAANGLDAASADNSSASAKPRSDHRGSPDWTNIEYVKYTSKQCGEFFEQYSYQGDKDCSFAMDVPTFLKRVPSKADHGRCFRSVDVEVSVWAYPAQVMPFFCKKEEWATTYKKNKTSCWQSGKFRSGKNGERIVWQREISDGAVVRALVFNYPSELKTQMDPIVTRINASWHHPIGASDSSTPADTHEDANDPKAPDGPFEKYEDGQTWVMMPYDCP